MIFPSLLNLLDILLGEEPSSHHVVSPDYREKLPFVFDKCFPAYADDSACFEKRIKIFSLVVMIMPFLAQVFPSLVP
jgi:hypothetical protein